MAGVPPTQVAPGRTVKTMASFYPRLIGGFFLFLGIGVLVGAALGMFIALASLPLVGLFPPPTSAPQIAIIAAAIAGLATAAIVTALGVGAWHKRLQADLYRERSRRLHQEIAPPARPLGSDRPAALPSRRRA